MIVPDSEKFLDYVSQIKDRVNNLVKGINVEALPEIYKTKIIENKTKIYARLSFITMHAKNDFFVSQDSWKKQTREIDGFVNELSGTIAQVVACLKTKETIIR